MQLNTFYQFPSPQPLRLYQILHPVFSSNDKVPRFGPLGVDTNQPHKLPFPPQYLPSIFVAKRSESDKSYSFSNSLNKNLTPHPSPQSNNYKIDLQKPVHIRQIPEGACLGQV